MDELICPICGRANLMTAVNCRYCQSPLEKSSQQSVNSLFSSKDLDANFNKPNISSKPNPQDKSMKEPEEPEWLKRIRELRLADEEKEKEKEQWRQQTFFGQESNKKTNRKPSANEKKDESTSANPQTGQVIQSEGQQEPLKEDKPQPETSENSYDNDDNESLGDVSSELPDGFTPLSNEEENSTIQ
jgi:hypothetical protein